MPQSIINANYTAKIGDWINPQDWTWAQAKVWIDKIETCFIPFNELDFGKAQTFKHIIVLDPCNTVRRLEKANNKFAERLITQATVLN